LSGSACQIIEQENVFQRLPVSITVSKEHDFMVAQ